MATTANGFESALDQLIGQRVAQCFDQLDPLSAMPPPPIAAPVDIIVPAHDAFEVFSECLQRLLEYTDVPHRLVLVDDASTDPSVWSTMQAIADEHAHVDVRPNVEDLGYLRTMNRAISGSHRDVGAAQQRCPGGTRMA